MLFVAAPWAMSWPHRLPAVGRLVFPAGLCNFAARRLERLGQHPRRQLAGLYG